MCLCTQTDADRFGNAREGGSLSYLLRRQAAEGTRGGNAACSASSVDLMRKWCDLAARALGEQRRTLIIETLHEAIASDG